jgi:hypothetical protein
VCGVVCVCVCLSLSLSVSLSPQTGHSNVRNRMQPPKISSYEWYNSMQSIYEVTIWRCIPGNNGTCILKNTLSLPYPYVYWHCYVIQIEIWLWCDSNIIIITVCPYAMYQLKECHFESVLSEDLFNWIFLWLYSKNGLFKYYASKLDIFRNLLNMIAWRLSCMFLIIIGTYCRI